MIRDVVKLVTKTEEHDRPTFQISWIKAVGCFRSSSGVDRWRSTIFQANGDRFDLRSELTGGLSGNLSPLAWVKLTIEQRPESLDLANVIKPLERRQS